MHRKRILKLLRVLGPGFITGAADDDPSGIATYSQTGAQFGYSQLWTAPFSTPLMIAIQEMTGRIGLVTGKGLSKVIRAHYPRPVLFFSTTLLVIANAINIGADLGAMAASAELLIDIPFVVWLLTITALTLILEVFVTYRTYARYLKYLTLSLFSYVIVVFVVKQDWGKILQSTFVPTVALTRDYLLNLVAILGTTISPYLFFWQADEEVEEKILHHSRRLLGAERRRARRAIQRMRWDTVIGMTFSNVVMFFIIATTASTLNVNGIRDVPTANQAALALRPLAGKLTFLLFALGVIGTGLLAVPVLAGSASYAMAEAFGWKVGLYKRFRQAHGFYGVITIAMILGLLVNFIGVPAFRMLYYTAALNGIVAPPLMLLIVLICNNEKIMGEYVNRRVSNVLGWLTIGLMSIAAIALLLS